MPLRLHRFNVDEYHRMADAGVLDEDDPVELLDGLIFVKMDYGPPYGVPLGIPPAMLLGPRDWAESPLRKFTVAEYHQMLEAEIIRPGVRTELVEGWIIDKMTHKPKHDSTLQRLAEALQSRLGTQWKLRLQSASTLDEGEPEPDLAVVPGPVGRFDQHHPGPSELALVVEVSDTTLPYDRSAKLRSYARNYVAVYWIVNVMEEQIEVYTEPSGPTDVPCYGKQLIHRRGAQVPLALRGQAVAMIPVEEILPATA